ncbi:hypothetical protein B4U79_19121 [Dinothrombium tinctorium]|uniref:Ig-like domain-containing protein n=1 Tax=Dinothrombium tinctorium TaxID=1965070 RepID=A0A443QJI4_9ACAR|nr:hypothetical protein B4U79_19121 [Dinothrombium tinctorium]
MNALLVEFGLILIAVNVSSAIESSALLSKAFSQSFEVNVQAGETVFMICDQSGEVVFVVKNENDLQKVHEAIKRATTDAEKYFGWSKFVRNVKRNNAAVFAENKPCLMIESSSRNNMGSYTCFYQSSHSAKSNRIILSSLLSKLIALITFSDEESPSFKDHFLHFSCVTTYPFNHSCIFANVFNVNVLSNRNKARSIAFRQSDFAQCYVVSDKQCKYSYVWLFGFLLLFFSIPMFIILMSALKKSKTKESSSNKKHCLSGNESKSSESSETYESSIRTSDSESLKDTLYEAGKVSEMKKSEKDRKYSFESEADFRGEKLFDDTFEKSKSDFYQRNKKSSLNLDHAGDKASVEQGSLNQKIETKSDLKLLSPIKKLNEIHDEKNESVSKQMAIASNNVFENMFFRDKRNQIIGEMIITGKNETILKSKFSIDLDHVYSESH